jgi:biopolymer transport protein ExbD
MSANFGGTPSQDVEVNITPIIDCFTVLITFLLASASFLSIGFFEAATPGTTAGSTSLEPMTELVVRVKNTNVVEFVEKGGRTGKFQFDLTSPAGEKAMDEELNLLAGKPNSNTRILLTANDSVGFESIAKVMGHLNRTSFPIVIGDFKE